MACQVPVIATNSGGIPEIMVQGVTGFMSNVGDIEEMAKHAVTILADDALHNQFKMQALEQAKKYDLKKILPLYEAYYEKVLQQAAIVTG